MKVKCVRLLNANGADVESSPWLSLNAVYHVMEIFIGSDGKKTYRVLTKETPDAWPDMGCHDSRCFSIVTEVVPSNWKVEILPNGAITIGPASWQEPGYLEAFYDHDPETYPIFEKERDIVLSAG